MRGQLFGAALFLAMLATPLWAQQGSGLGNMSGGLGNMGGGRGASTGHMGGSMAPHGGARPSAPASGPVHAQGLSAPHGSGGSGWHGNGNGHGNGWNGNNGHGNGWNGNGHGHGWNGNNVRFRYRPYGWGWGYPYGYANWGWYPWGVYGSSYDNSYDYPSDLYGASNYSADNYGGYGYDYPGYAMPPGGDSTATYASPAEAQRIEEQVNQSRARQAQGPAPTLGNPPSLGNYPSAADTASLGDTSHPNTVLVYRDGHTETVNNYAIAGKTLWVFDPYQAKKIPLSDLDLPATKQNNDERGNEFVVPNGR